ncbi:hypothetical protein [Glutamicibacter creatinolyticus]|uniref:hypothetical protein n=1 Tax=Glutamicibacter creatinolyticus TaxID=162496 RepID=UPI0037C0E0CE
MAHHESIEDLADALLGSMTPKSRCALVFASNTTGKTRLAQHLKERDPRGVVLYNAFVEDVFTWDNEQIVLKMNLDSELLNTIETQGLDGEIVENFRAFTHDKIEPLLDFENGEVRFGIHKGDDASADSVKISRAEESIFIWCVYYSVLSEAISTLSDSPELRTTTDYDFLNLAVIDDPVSSMDDVRIVSVAMALADLIKRSADLDIKFIVTTHHALFFNVLFNSIHRAKGMNNQAFTLERNLELGWRLEKQGHDSPFSYHLGIIRNIEDAISQNSIQRIHFNQFRTLLEKTANFLGYEQGWGVLLAGPDAKVLTRILNLYSHDRFSDIDSSEVSDEYKKALTTEFHTFLNEFRWGFKS